VVKTQGKRTFRGILNEVASENANKLMRRARIANKLAKSLKGRSRSRAYEVKSRAVLGLRKGFPDGVRVVHDCDTPGFVVVRVPAANFGLHVPVRLLEMTTHSISLNWR
jgi:hypothetical protein